MSECKIEGCGRTVYRMELCRRHDYRRVKYGDPSAGGPLRNTDHKAFCSFPGCSGPYLAKGLCNKHYQARQRNGDAVYQDRGPLQRDLPCSVDGCTNKRKGGSYCGKHYQRLRLNGDPLVSRRGEIGKGTVSHKGYIIVYRPDHPNANKHGRLPEQRLVMSEILGRPLRDDETVHHKNGVRSDNRPENLEVWTGNHSNGARLEDVYAWAKEFIRLHEADIRKLSAIADAKGGGRN